MTLKATTEEFLEAWTRFGSVKKVAAHLKMDVRSVNYRRAKLREKGHTLDCLSKQALAHKKGPAAQANALAGARKRYEHRMEVGIRDGVVLVMSDAHYWPGIVTTAHQAFVKLCKELKPKAIVANGDILDGSRISRHTRIGWENQPALKDELAAVQDRMGEIERAAKGALKIRTIGNHCVRFETYISNNAAELEGIFGVTLLDHLPAWRAGWSLWINESVVVKHRYAGGIHAVYNNTLKSGMSIVTGHLHSLKVTPWTDYRGTRYGVDTGTLADPTGPQFVYLEDNPVNWRSGFAVLTFDKDGHLMPPETCEVVRGRAIFRGQPV
jgi:hypothetical protein